MTNATQTFYGWRVVRATLVVAFVAWAFALYGPSVYIDALSHTHGWSTASVSMALSMAFLVNALSIGFVGTLVGRHGPQAVMSVGAIVMALGIAALGQVSQPWQMVAAFITMGLGWSCLSTIAVSATIAPWFEKFQGKAISTALLGASLGGMLGVPITLFLVQTFGFTAAMAIIGTVTVLTILPISIFILRRRPQDMGLWPDGLAPEVRDEPVIEREWTRGQALKTFALRSTIITFGLALMVQLGFLSQQVKLLQTELSPTLTGLTILASGSLAFIGRVVLARVADRVNIRLAAAVVLWLAAAGLLVAAFASTATWLVIGVLLFGLNVGNITTLPALIVRREFGAPSFGKVFGITGTFMQLMNACGPALFGFLHDTTGGYDTPITIAALVMIAGSLLIAHGQWPWRQARAVTPN
ncbi:MFS transporter [Orrella daihaiensis]|uniref:MFS transporter n=1 Tax=Orrella daihaiensis TaxID=2782176 RepID=A0ABY4ALC2_9BURK|nr:MFS transporter [Orrella daihaiensis]UOD51089.1 MFS transporter [Orrella daihaiensis]